MEKNKENRVWTKWLYWFSLAVAVVVVYKTLDNFTEISDFIKNLLGILMPFAMGVLIAYLLYIPCRKFEGWFSKCKWKFLDRHKRGLSVFIVYLIAIFLIILVINFVLPSLSQSILDLVNNLPNYYNNTMKTLEELPEDSIFNKINAKQIISNLQNIDLGQFFNIESITMYAKGVINIATSLFDCFVSLIVSVYILIERRQIINFAKKLANAIFKRRTYQMIGKYFYKTNEVFFRFLSSQLLDAIVVAILTSIAMVILNVKYGVLLGVMIGIFNLIPYLGAIIAVIIAIIITLFTGGLSQAIWVAVVITILQQIDANVINPRITGTSLKISPLLVIFAVTFGGAYFGILGMFLAVPIATVIRLFILDYIDYKNEIKIEQNN